MAMTEATHGDYDTTEVSGLSELKDRLQESDSIEALSHILSDYITWGNNKVHKNTAIFNMNSATDCPNAEKEACQVPFESCYAHKAESQYPNPLPYRRRQEYLWDSLAPEEWAMAFMHIVNRKRNPVHAIRFSEAGDFRHNMDVEKVDTIAQILKYAGIKVYTYSASHYLDWSNAENFTVNASNDLSEYGDRRFMAVESPEDIPDGTAWCPFDKQTHEGITEGRIKCGECQLCLDKEGPDVAVVLH